jgi:hypothetical protein
MFQKLQLENRKAAINNIILKGLQFLKRTSRNQLNSPETWRTFTPTVQGSARKKWEREKPVNQNTLWMSHSVICDIVLHTDNK